MPIINDIGRVFAGPDEIGTIHDTSGVLWPLEYVYLFSNIQVVYSSSNQILADASNYAYVTAYVTVKQGSVIVDQGTKTLSVLAINDNRNFHITNSGARVTANDLGTDPYYDGLSTTITSVSYGSSGAVTVSLNVVQQYNRSTQISSLISYTGYSFTLDETDFQSTGGTGNIISKALYDSTPRYQWTTGDISYGTTTHNNEETVTPATITVSPSSGVVINAQKTKITFPANTGDSAVDYTITATWSTYSSIETASVSSVTYTFGAVTITSYGYEEIPAYGGTVKPYITFKQAYGVNGALTGYEISGSVSAGETEKTVTDDRVTVKFKIAYKVNGSTSQNGAVTANSLGNTETSSQTTIATGCSVTVTGNDNKYNTSSTVSVVQEINEKTHVDPEYISVAVNSFKVGGSAVQSIPTAAQVTVSVDVLATWREDGYVYTAYPTDPNAYRGRTLHQNSVETPTKLTVNGTESSGASFSASNIHQTSNKSYSVKAYFGKYSDTDSITQTLDAKIDAMKDFAATLTFSGNTIAASGGSATLIPGATHTNYKYWESGGSSDVVSGSEQTNRPDSVTIIRKSGGTRFELDTTTYVVTHTNMEKNTGTDTVVYYAKNANASAPGTAVSADVSFSATNERSSTPVRADDWHPVGEKTYYTPTSVDSNIRVSISSSAYTSTSSRAPFYGGTFNIISYSCLFDRTTYTPWTQAETGTNKYYYTSSTSSHEVYDTEQGTGTISGTDESTAYDQSTTPSFSSSESWLGISDIVNGNVTFGAQGSSGTSRRSATITASYRDRTSTVTLYQSPYAHISVDPESLVWTKIGGSLKFTVSYVNTAFTISHSGQGTSDPVSSVSPTSGGSSSGSGTREITVTAPENSSGTGLYGEIAVTPGNSELGTVYVDTNTEGTPASGTYSGLPLAIWGSSYRINYECYVTNNSDTLKPFTVTLTFRYTTGSQQPGSGTLISTKTVTGEVPAHTQNSLIGSGYVTASKVSGRTYWVQASCALFTSEWLQVEE